MTIFHLLYASKSFKPIQEALLLSILEVSRRNNKKLGVTGLLMARESYFLQLLEGEEAVVHELYNKIAEDDRHGEARILLKSHSDRRIFPDWQMGFVDPRLSSATIDKVWEVIDAQVIEAKTDREALLKLLRAFNQVG